MYTPRYPHPNFGRPSSTSLYSILVSPVCFLKSLSPKYKLKLVIPIAVIKQNMLECCVIFDCQMEIKNLLKFNKFRKRGHFFLKFLSQLESWLKWDKNILNCQLLFYKIGGRFWERNETLWICMPMGIKNGMLWWSGWSMDKKNFGCLAVYRSVNYLKTISYFKPPQAH